jgi:hypothetical protein
MTLRDAWDAEAENWVRWARAPAAAAAAAYWYYLDYSPP